MHDINRSLDIVYNDFQKAFDKLPRKKLMFKINLFGIAYNVHNWIQNWLIIKKQKVVILSTDLPQIRHQSQGSVIQLHNFIAKLVDDTKIEKSVIADSNRQSLQKDLHNVRNALNSINILNSTNAIFFKWKHETKNMDTK